MKLLLVELTRLRWRRAARLLALTSVVVPILILAGLAWSTRPVSDAEIKRAERTMAEQEKFAQDALEDCLQNPENFGIPDGLEPEQACPEMTGAGEQRVEWYLERPPLDVSDAPDETGSAAAVIVMGLAMLIGTTFVGADWASGSMGNQLLFEPRRPRVWLAKGAAVALGALAICVVSMAVFWALFWGVAASRDLTLSSDLWRDIGWLSARASLMAAGAAVGGFALTMFLRTTVGTLGLMFGVAVGGSLLVAALPFDGNGRWMLPHNVLGVLQNGYQYYDESLQTCTEADYMSGKNCEFTATLSLAEGLRFLGVLLVIGVALSLPSFLRRDVS